MSRPRCVVRVDDSGQILVTSGLIGEWASDMVRRSRPLGDEGVFGALSDAGFLWEDPDRQGLVVATHGDLTIHLYGDDVMIPVGDAVSRNFRRFTHFYTVRWLVADHHPWSAKPVKGKRSHYSLTPKEGS